MSEAFVKSVSIFSYFIYTVIVCVEIYWKPAAYYKMVSSIVCVEIYWKPAAYYKMVSFSLNVGNVLSDIKKVMLWEKGA